MNNRLSELNGTAAGSALEEPLWLLSQQSRALQDLRKDIMHVWDDEAAREINGRYFNPHEKDDSKLKAALNEQRELLEQADRSLESAKDIAQVVDECAAVVMEKLQFAEQDMDSAYSNYDLYLQYNSEARSKFPLVQELIIHANAACD
jgi:hypothetical protein